MLVTYLEVRSLTEHLFPSEEINLQVSMMILQNTWHSSITMMQNYYNLNSSNMTAPQKQLYNPAPMVQKPPSWTNKNTSWNRESIHLWLLHTYYLPQNPFTAVIFSERNVMELMFNDSLDDGWVVMKTIKPWILSIVFGSKQQIQCSSLSG